MNKEIVKAVAMYALTSVMTALATRYHLSGEQTAAIMSDVVALGTGVGGVYLHHLAYMAQPPKA